MDDPNSYDVIIVGTNLRNSILSAALSWANQRVLHIDENSFYGEIDGSLTLRDLEQINEKIKKVDSSQILNDNGSHKSPLKRFEVQFLNKDLIPKNKGSVIQFHPQEIFASSELVKLLSETKIYKYLLLKPARSFRLLTSNEEWIKVPESRADIFNNKNLSLASKRIVMRFMKFVSNIADEQNQNLVKEWESKPFYKFLEEVFQLSGAIEESIIYGLCQSLSKDIPTKDALDTVLKYFHSFGMYGDYSYLLAMYGTGSELCQGFCRSSAVMGGTFMLGQAIDKIDESKIVLKDGSTLSAKKIVSSVDEGKLPHQQIQQRYLLVKGDCQQLFQEDGFFAALDASLIHFSPFSISENFGNSVQAKLYGSGSGDCPEGYCIWYLKTLNDSPCNEVFNLATKKLCSFSGCDDLEIIVQVDETLNQLRHIDYDDTLHSAKSLFYEILGQNNTFLQREGLFDEDDE
ncbi:Rab geranylgeranyltransferase escort protein Mrs6 [Schizosaccharomyces pombe]|uniref:Uncharacterized Rab geranylgeranyltransferase C15C4.03 n=1 Tax=Schizosaccharomyces pombe (strain 972 / ATCC 24843) TaxID=284812 RepID=YG63_SCHPO|nr:putative Rab geranylgeranyltransferase escort protein [Schizosaccharomyces pombe]O60112.1 RecName: Full=Uncharacterized Rab geranylgeranyltransferase C15C4.03 [Schizosaccharomyces pombe 972h-]CAA18894.1 Rab geranylgeranyltransferase escort protein (predicted) [Schizosaccharomyces pombe]|eukprot:NP_595923.1 putative Rab geranylgeranyltransferase escort protein [Schizosaccharomyces pombe]